MSLIPIVGFSTVKYIAKRIHEIRMVPMTRANFGFGILEVIVLFIVGHLNNGFPENTHKGLFGGITLSIAIFVASHWYPIRYL